MSADLAVDEHDASIARARVAGLTLLEEILWQIENDTAGAKGFASWQEFRDETYGDLRLVVSRDERPGLVARARAAGLTQEAIAGTFGISQQTISDDLITDIGIQPPPTIKNARGQARPPTYRKRPPMEATRPGVSKWSRAVQSISKRLPVDELTNDELAELLGAATFLAHYCRGVLTTRKATP